MKLSSLIVFFECFEQTLTLNMIIKWCFILLKMLKMKLSRLIFKNILEIKY
jgi:hypothetical protein